MKQRDKNKEGATFQGKSAPSNTGADGKGTPRAREREAGADGSTLGKAHGRPTRVRRLPRLQAEGTGLALRKPSPPPAWGETPATGK